MNQYPDMFERYLLRVRRCLWKVLMYFNYFSRREVEIIKREYPPVMTLEQTVDKIIAGASIARFGDGEFKLVLGSRLHFQRWDSSLVKRLNEVLSSPPDERILIGIPSRPDFLSAETTAGEMLRYFLLRLRKDLFGIKINTVMRRRFDFYAWFWLTSFRFLRRGLLSCNFWHSDYADAMFSRLALFQTLPLERIKQIWQDRPVVFVVPKNGHFVFEQRLFDNIKQAEYIYIPPVNAWDDYGRILSECLNYGKEYLFFIAAGPTATVLAFDLAKQGRQALDIGHLPNCYLEFLGEAESPESLPAVSCKDMPLIKSL